MLLRSTLTACLTLWASMAFAGDWGTISIISSTMGVHGSRICIGEASRGDVGCPTYAPSVTTAGDVSVTGTLSAAKFIGDGSLLTGIAGGGGGQSDRIISGTTGITAQGGGVISITTNGSTANYFNIAGLLVTPGISVTTGNGISSTNGYFSARLGVNLAAPDAPLAVKGVSGAGGGQMTIRPGDDDAESSILFKSKTDGSGGVSGNNWWLGQGVWGAGAGNFGIGNSTNRLTILANGNTGVDTTTPAATLDVNGSVYSRSHSAGSASSVDFSLGNVQYTTAACGAFTLSNTQDGGAYSLIVTGSGTGPATFTHSGLTIATTGTLTCTAGKKTLFGFIRAGSTLFVTMTTGY